MSKGKHSRRSGNVVRTDSEQHSLSLAEARAVAQRREDAEEKLERQLRASEQKDKASDDGAGT